MSPALWMNFILDELVSIENFKNNIKNKFKITLMINNNNKFIKEYKFKKYKAKI